MKLPELYINELGALQLLVAQAIKDTEDQERAMEKMLKKKLFWRFFAYPRHDPQTSKVIITMAYFVAAGRAAENKKFCTDLLAKLDEATGEGEDGMRITFREMKEKANKKA